MDIIINSNQGKDYNNLYSRKQNNIINFLNRAISTIFKEIFPSLFDLPSPKLEKPFCAIRCGGGNDSDSQLAFIFQETLPFEERIDEAREILNNYIPKEKTIYIINDEGTLRSFPTSGSGSCGFHSLLGRYDKSLKRFHLEDYKGERVRFANWINNQFLSQDLTKEIKDSLREYISNLNTAPSSLQSALKHKDNRETYKKFLEFKALDTPETREYTDVLLTALISEKKVQDAYLNHIKNSSSYLLPSELGAAAVWAGKTVYIYQTQDGVEPASPPCIYNEGKKEVIEIVLIEQKKHFERAVYQPF